jgi:hypothetical protein
MLQPDEAHPADHAAWDIVKAPGWMKVATRPRLMPHEKANRKKETRHVRYVNNAEQVRAKSQANRDELRGVADAGTQLGDVAAPVLSAARHWVAAQSWQETMPAFETLFPPDAQPSVEMFLNLVTYLLPVQQWPQPLFDPLSPPSFAEKIPGTAQYKSLSLLCHPDKRPDVPPYAQQMLNDSWAQIKSEMEEWSAVERELLAAGTPDEEWRVPIEHQRESFESLSHAHQRIHTVYLLWLKRYEMDLNWYVCQSASLHDLRRAKVDEGVVESAARALDRVAEGKGKLAARDARKPKRKTPQGASR